MKQAALYKEVVEPPVYLHYLWSTIERQKNPSNIV